MFMAARRVLFGPGKPRVDSRPDPRTLGRGLTDPLTHGRGLLPAMQLRLFHRHIALALRYGFVLTSSF